jgi:putative Ca2+/H+ antiporter (TMEM165/GDT1 family)
MNLGVALTTFALVIPAELPDKTFISCVVLSSRHKSLPVWIGAALALTVQALLAVLAGGLLSLLPHTDVRIVVAVLFIGGAAYLIFVPEKTEEDKGARLGDKPISARSDWRVFWTTFSIIALAEFGDITQVLIANLAARYKDPVGVFLGATVGFLVVSAAGVLAGRTITKYVPLSLVRRLSGVALLGFGIWTIVSLLA